MATNPIEQLQSASLETSSLASQTATTTPNSDGTVTVDFSDAKPEEDSGGLDAYEDQTHYSNLVEQISDEEKLRLASLVMANVQADEESRSDWMRTIEFGMDLLGVKVEEKNTPFEGACSAQHPLLMESAVKFQSKASNELLPANGPVKTRVLGDCALEKEDQANRVKNHMNYQITEEMTEFYTDTERMLLYVPLVGSGFKKTYYNVHLERPCSEFVPADQFIVPNSAHDLYRADRYTHILYKTDYELDADCNEGFYSKPLDGLGVPTEAKLTPVQRKTNELIGVRIGLGERDKVYTLYEQHINIFVEGLDKVTKKGRHTYKLASPYIITVDSGSQKVIGLRRNWKENDSKRKKRCAFTHFSFVPSFNFYSFGFLHLLGNLQLTLTAALRSLVDAGQFATLQGGFKLKGVRIVDDGSPISPGQFKEIETSIQDINKALMPLPFKEPSNVLFQMLNFLDAKGQKFADSTEQVIADSSNYGPVGTTMALLEASTKFFSAIHKRLHNSLKNELRIIADINSETLEDDNIYNIENQTAKVSRADYDDTVDIVPVSDPNISSAAQRMAKAQTLYELAMRAPELHDMREVLKHVYINMDYTNIDKIMPKPEEASPQDPLTDVQLAVQGKPIQAYPGQDHESHIALKQAFLQNPATGQSPLMQKASQQIAANLQQHLFLQFQEQIQATMQQQVPEQMQAQVEAQAAQKVAQLNMQRLQQQIEQGKQSPKDQATLLLAQAEMMDSQTQARKQQFTEQTTGAELALKKRQLDIHAFKEVNRTQEAKDKIAAQKDLLVTGKGLDAITKGLHQGYEAKMQKELIATKPIDKPKK